MKESVKKFIFIKNLIVWGIISLCCIVAIGTFIKLFIEDRAAGKDIFLPGVLVLTIVVLGLLAFSITRVIKYIKRLK